MFAGFDKESRFAAACESWQPYDQVLPEQARSAIHVLHRFPIVNQLGDAIDQPRAAR